MFRKIDANIMNIHDRLVLVETMWHLIGCNVQHLIRKSHKLMDNICKQSDWWLCHKHGSTSFIKKFRTYNLVSPGEMPAGKEIWESNGCLCWIIDDNISLKSHSDRSLVWSKQHLSAPPPSWPGLLWEFIRTSRPARWAAIPRQPSQHCMQMSSPEPRRL